ncbi:MAG: GNAT family N-acetyltransferase [Coxiellaceae bacterium]|nr:GNAT family N-acetyltransferase [Coxiellaceae bacterium]
MQNAVIKDFTISVLGKNHNRKLFNCGVGALNEYFCLRAGQEGRKKLSVCYVLNDEKNQRVVGYYTLSSAVIELLSLPQLISKKLLDYPFMPATLLGRLAIDSQYKQKGYGELLLIDALKRAYHASLEVASLAVIVDAKDIYADKFYKKYDFYTLQVRRGRLFLTMKHVKKLFVHSTA